MLSPLHRNPSPSLHQHYPCDRPLLRRFRPPSRLVRTADQPVSTHQSALAQAPPKLFVRSGCAVRAPDFDLESPLGAGRALDIRDFLSRVLEEKHGGLHGGRQLVLISTLNTNAATQRKGSRKLPCVRTTATAQRQLNAQCLFLEPNEPLGALIDARPRAPPRSWAWQLPRQARTEVPFELATSHLRAGPIALPPSTAATAAGYPPARLRLGHNSRQRWIEASWCPPSHGLCVRLPTTAAYNLGWLLPATRVRPIFLYSAT